MYKIVEILQKLLIISGLTITSGLIISKTSLARNNEFVIGCVQKLTNVCNVVNDNNEKCEQAPQT